MKLDVGGGGLNVRGGRPHTFVAVCVNYSQSLHESSVLRIQLVVLGRFPSSELAPVYDPIECKDIIIDCFKFMKATQSHWRENMSSKCKASL